LRLFVLLVVCNRLAVLVRDFGCKGSTLLYYHLVDLICYGSSLHYKNSV
jgi:hypothetical protein